MLALDAMLTGSPQKLFDTCVTHQISMCGLLPAVTVMQALLQETPTVRARLVDYSNSAAASGDYSRGGGVCGRGDRVRNGRGSDCGCTIRDAASRVSPGAA